MRRLTLLFTAAAMLIPAAAAIGAQPAVAAAPCPPRTVSVNDAARPEGSPGHGAALIFTVTPMGCAPGSVRYATLPGGFAGAPAATSGVDYQPVAGVLDWAAGDTSSRTITVGVVGDSLVEPDEAFALELSHPIGVVLTDPVGVGLIMNDDVTLSMAIGKPHCDELCVSCRLRVVTSAPAPFDLTVHIATTDGTATAGSDYGAVRDETLTIPAGASTAEFGVAIQDDRATERDETFSVSLFDASSGEIRDGVALVTITDDD